MHRNRKFLKKPFVFLILFFGLAAIGGAYSSWHSALSAEMKMTSGVMDILFAENSDEKYSVYLTDESGNNETLIDAKFSTTDKEVEITFNEGLPVNSLGEDEAAFMEPLQFEVYKTLSEESNDEFGGQIYLKLQADSAEKILELPVSFIINSEKMQESIDFDFNEGNLVASVGSGVVVTYSCDIPFDVFQGGSKVQDGSK